MKRYLAVRVLFPILALAGRFLPGLREKIEKKIISINNRLILQGRYANVLLLLPHCIQLDECPYRITMNILNCKSCGKCDVAGILELEKKFGIIIRVATGGRLAKRWVKEIGMEMVVAVACEQELVEGIMAVYPTRVFAISNLRPFGPCINTKVDIEHLKDVMEKFLESRVDDKRRS